MRLFLMNLLGLEAVLDRRLKLLDREHRREVDKLQAQHQATLARIETSKEVFGVEVKQGRKGRYRVYIRDDSGTLLLCSPAHGHASEGEAQGVVSRLFNGRRLSGPQSVAP